MENVLPMINDLQRVDISMLWAGRMQDTMICACRSKHGFV